LRSALVLAALVAAPAAGAQTPVAPGARTVAADPAREAPAFDEARALYDGRLYGPAARAFGAFLDRYPESPRAPEALFLQADATLATADDAAAAALFAQFEAAHPASPLAPRARLALGRYYYATGDYARAEGALLEAPARPAAPELEAEAATLLGQTALKQDRPDAAVDAFERAAAGETPFAPAALYALGAVHAGQGRPALAASAFERLAARYPESPENRTVGLALAEAYLRTGRLAEAAAEIEGRRPALTGDDGDRADLLLGETRLRLGDVDGAVAPLSAVPATGPYARRAALALGRAAFAQGGWAEAVAFFEAARGEGAADDPVAHEARYYEALALREAGRLGDAERLLRAVVERRPNGPYAEAALLELGLLLYVGRRYEEAGQTFGRLLAESPQGPYAGEAARMEGEAYAALGDADRAAEAFRRAERLGTASVETRAEVAFQEAYARFRSGDYDAAVEALLAVAAADPTGPRAGEALFWAGEAAYQAGRYARAEEVLSDFVARFPDHRQADAGRYVLAWTHFRRRDYAAAAVSFERFLSAYDGAAESVPYYADALLRLGDAYFALGRYADARAVYARAPAATPDRAGGDYALYQTAQAFGSQGRSDDALAAYDRLLREYPSSGLFAQALVAQGALYAARGDDSLAVATYERVVRERAQSPAAPRALVGIGDVRANQERYADAEAAYRAALARYPASPLAVDALDGLAFALEAQGRGDEVETAVADAERRVTAPDARARIRLSRAQSALAAGEDSLAVVRLEALLGSGDATGEVEAEALLALAGAYTATGDPTSGARALRRLLTRYPDSPLAPEAQLQLAGVLLDTGDAQAALDVAAGYPALYPDDAERVAAALALEADALDALGRAPEADDRRRALVERYPDTAAAQALLRVRPDLAPRGEGDGGEDDDF
jgi:TolA-binding protein